MHPIMWRSSPNGLYTLHAWYNLWHIPTEQLLVKGIDLSRAIFLLDKRDIGLCVLKRQISFLYNLMSRCNYFSRKTIARAEPIYTHRPSVRSPAGLEHRGCALSSHVTITTNQEASCVGYACGAAGTACALQEARSTAML